MPPTFSTIGGGVMIDITVNCGVCIWVLCVITVAEEAVPSTVNLCNLFVGAVVTVEPLCCDASSVSGVRSREITGSNDIICLMGVVGVPPVPPVSPDAILQTMRSVFFVFFHHTTDGTK